MEKYEGFYWDYPGFPSIAVPYGGTNDFFYSGHIGCCVLCFLEFKHYGWVRARYLCLVIMTCNIMLLLVTRGHYTIDMIAGAIFAHYFYMLSYELYDPRPFVVDTPADWWCCRRKKKEPY